MRIKIRGGTVQHGESSLCMTCRHAIVVKGQSLRKQIGFIQARKLEPKDRYVLPNDDEW